MHKTDFITELSKRANISLKQADEMANHFLAILQETLCAGDSITFTGFGSLGVKERAARTGRNPKTGETLNIAATKVPYFKPGKQLKSALNS